MAYGQSGLLRRLTFNVRFPGQYFDEESGMHYNRFRYYDPEIGRYVSADPIGQKVEDGSLSLNIYTYSANSPLVVIDPLGLEEEEAVVRGSRAVLEEACRNKLRDHSCCAPGAEPEGCEAAVQECMVAMGFDIAGATASMLSTAVPGLPKAPATRLRPGKESAERIGDLVGEFAGDVIEAGADFFSGSDADADECDECDVD